MDFTCIMCPVGCNLNVTKNGNEITVFGNGCPRGEIYGKNEITLPKRMITTIKKYKNGTISLKTSEAIDKNLIEKVLKEINEFMYRKTEQRIKQEEVEAQKQRANDFGIGA